MALVREQLRTICNELRSRPGHEKVRVLVHQLLVQGLGASSSEIDFEKPIPEVHGRIDALLGRTVFEFKSNLRRERKTAEEELERYLGEREHQTQERFVGIATDGADFTPYELRNGTLRGLASFELTPTTEAELLPWLSSVVAVSAQLDPTPDVVRRELGRESLAWQIAAEEFADVWDEVKAEPDVALKRSLWSRTLERVYGSNVDDDDLFFQHTYLSVVAKTMALHVLGLDLPSEPGDLLSGLPLEQAGISGVVESDFFDWPLNSLRGEDLVARVAAQAARFRLDSIEHDVLKGLYESLIDPGQRHDLGEYYTPDWLAVRVSEAVVDDPLSQRVMDPACGSGTFLFHAVRRYLASAETAGHTNREALLACTSMIVGVDVHPVSIQIARVTYLLAIGEERLSTAPNLSIPVYMGDVLQWNTRGFLAERDVVIEIPADARQLEFPGAVTGDPAFFDALLARMTELSEDGAEATALTAWLRREANFDDGTIEKLARTFEVLAQLNAEGRNHIWAFVARNLSRPLWLSQDLQKFDRLIGNPPWLAFNRMAAPAQTKFKEESQRLGVWVGGRGVTPHQDLCAYFFARCVELYLKPQGRIGFVMPYAALTRGQYAKFRTGMFGSRQGRTLRVAATVEFDGAWALEAVTPLFPVPAAVLFGALEQVAAAGALEGRSLPNVQVATGTLPRRDASVLEAEELLTWSTMAWPAVRATDAESTYASRFRQGAIVIPRVLWMVKPVDSGRLGRAQGAPLVESRRSPQEKAPWKSLASLRGNVERQFIRNLYLGESIVPFRVIAPSLAVIPWDNELLNAAQARERGFNDLARWLSQSEEHWVSNHGDKRTLLEELDFFGQMSAQFPIPRLRVVFGKAGTHPAAALLADQSGVIDHNLYWMPTEYEDEALYLLAILNSEAARARVEHLQSRGQWGARHFDKVMLELPLPVYAAGVALHENLVDLARRAQAHVGSLTLDPAKPNTTLRSQARRALVITGISAQLDEAVSELLG